MIDTYADLWTNIDIRHEVCKNDTNIMISRGVIQQSNSFSASEGKQILHEKNILIFFHDCRNSFVMMKFLKKPNVFLEKCIIINRL